ncbi:flagellar M-ring protein FliF [Thioalkalivibrio sp. ALE21]|uniref:flagellar basal-body MS-ring/collar protein FliF n=1 Tax=Thioalkalivibrio sp. ALE21 TaxID=1158175 RepID=UPI000D84D3D7|nr:flagellar basal-body MS-ring/collar protein FliF [Thioalkalivibrio sp. ALE21]PYG04083.1 flagellar M-ring protein FliF [Thioalkalivibrio sp. ALE21]
MAAAQQSLPAVVSGGIKDFGTMPAGRQLALIGMLAGALAVIAGIVFWAMSPTFVPLYSSLDQDEAAEVVTALDGAGIRYRIDTNTGQIKVPRGDVGEARLHLAGEGLPRSGDVGFELLQEDTGIGTSRMMESARHRRAMEGELGRTVSSLDAVERARVHIAEGQDSVFVRERTPATASVTVHLHGGRSLSESQVRAIVHMVASSTSDLSPENVTVVDQQGRLLTEDGMEESGMRSSGDRLSFQGQVERRYAEAIRDLLSPLVGGDRVRVQVSADIDFSEIERTEELYDPDTIALRSEQISEDVRGDAGEGPMGVPGALTNQPPAGGAVGEEEGEGAENGENGAAGQRSGSATRNYEVDRRIAHIREMPGGVERLSTAVVVDFREEVGEDGEVQRVARDAEEIERLENLVRQAVGFSEQRGDSINVVSAPFEAPVEEEIVEAERPFWTQAWFMELAKLIGALMLALIILLTVIRPALKHLMSGATARPAQQPQAESDENLALTDQSGESAAGGGGPSGEGSAVASLTGPEEDQQEMDLEAVRGMVKEDPKRVAQVMKTWLNEDGR